MVKITFEFRTVDAAVTFLRKGKLQNTNTTVGVLDDGDKSKPEIPEAAPAVNDPPLTARERRLAGIMGKATAKRGASKAKGVSKKGKGTDKKAGTKKASPAPVSDEISDADLSKAASIAAEQITPIGVTAILKLFDVSHVSELEDDQRRKFLNLIDQAIEAEK